jgi:hypothetical protein
MPRRVWGATATAVALALLALLATPARATTDRVDYSDQANPICAAANKQVVQLYETFEAEIERLDGIRTKNRKHARRLTRRQEQLYDQLPLQFLAIYRAELEQLKTIAAPPSFEDTVARWIGTRDHIAAVYGQYIQLEQQLDGPIGFVGRKPTRKAIKRAQKRQRNLLRLQEQIEQQLLADLDIDLELGAKMGAAYCVTGATGDITTNFIESGD